MARSAPHKLCCTGCFPNTAANIATPFYALGEGKSKSVGAGFTLPLRVYGLKTGRDVPAERLYLLPRSWREFLCISLSSFAWNCS